MTDVVFGGGRFFEVVVVVGFGGGGVFVGADTRTVQIVVLLAVLSDTV